MREIPSDVAFTPAVKAIQAQRVRRGYARMERGEGWQTAVTPDLAGVLADLDMFYLGTATADGQPHTQYRGGPPEFLKVIDEQTLGFADFGGNRQYVTLGNPSENPKAFLFLMDYANRRRVKVWGTPARWRTTRPCTNGCPTRRTRAGPSGPSRSRSGRGT